MKNLFLAFVAISMILISCQSLNSIDSGMTKEEVSQILGKADSVVVLPPTEDVYTNKLIKMEAWYYGDDTLLTFANGELVKGL